MISTPLVYKHLHRVDAHLGAPLDLGFQSRFDWQVARLHGNRFYNLYCRWKERNSPLISLYFAEQKILPSPSKGSSSSLNLLSYSSCGLLSQKICLSLKISHRESLNRQRRPSPTEPRSTRKSIWYSLNICLIFVKQFWIEKFFCKFLFILKKRKKVWFFKKREQADKKNLFRGHLGKYGKLSPKILLTNVENNCTKFDKI